MLQTRAEDPQTGPGPYFRNANEPLPTAASPHLQTWTAYCLPIRGGKFSPTSRTVTFSSYLSPSVLCLFVANQIHTSLT